MSVQIFKDGEMEYVEPKRLQSHLEAGWSVDDPDLPPLDPLALVPADRHIGNLTIPADATAEEAEIIVLHEMGILEDPLEITEPMLSTG